MDIVHLLVGSFKMLPDAAVKCTFLWVWLLRAVDKVKENNQGFVIKFLDTDLQAISVILLKKWY
jgi:hypothetical protein